MRDSKGLSPSDIYQGQFIAQFASANHSKIAVIFGVNNVYAVGIFNQIVANLSGSMREKKSSDQEWGLGDPLNLVLVK